jgi:hypothetical protein
MKEEGLKPIEEEPKKEEKKDINLPNLKKAIIENDDLIAKLPEWSIEPPLEINRGQK